MSRRTLLPLAASALVIGLLTGCTGPAPAPSPSPTPSASSDASTPTPTATQATDEHTVAVSIDGITVDGGALLSGREPEETLAALEQLLGPRPEPEQPDPAYDIVLYRWSSVQAGVESGTSISLTFTASDIPGLKFVLASGIGLGSTRAEAMAAGAQPVWDEDQDGIADYLSIERREVPGTNSLSEPGEVGVDFIELKITDDVVTQFANGGNDYADL